MKSRRARLLPAVAAAAALTLGALTACGGGGPDSSDDGRDPKSPAPEAGSSAPQESGGADGSPAPSPSTPWPDKPAEGEVPEDELGAYALAQGDVEGFTIRIPSKEELSGMGEEKSRTAACSPLAGLLSGAPEPEPSATVYRSLVTEADEKDPSGLILFETLAAYGAEDADTLLADVRKAIDACAGGFRTDTPGGQGIEKYTSVKELPKPSAGAADDALAFQLVGDADGTRFPILFNVVRNDSTVSVFYAMNLMQPDKAVIPEQIVRTQTRKLTG